MVAREQDAATRAAWRDLATQLVAADLRFLDESSTHTAMTRRQARAPRGQRAVGRVPRNHGPNVSLIATLALDGMGPAAVLEGAVDRLAFEAYLEQILVPALRPGQVVVLDNLSVHRGARVRALIEAAGCRLLFLPAYSPDYNPIEQALAKLKAHLRRVGARTFDALVAAIGTALAAITAADARAFFASGGYAASSQLL